MKCCFCECELIDGNSLYPIYKKYSISKEDVYIMGYEIKNNIMFLNELTYNDIK